jgi:uncharacterized protein (TIRG00374 family)
MSILKNKAVKTGLSLLLVVATGFGIYRVFTSTVDLHEVVMQLKQFTVVEIGTLLLISTLMMVERAYRFHLLLKNADQEVTFWQTFKVFITGQAFSPLPAGEGMRPVLLKKEAGIELERSMTPMIILGVSEMIVAVLIALIGSVFLGILRLAAAIAFVGMLGLVWILINRSVVKAIMAKLPKKEKIQATGKTVLQTQKKVKTSIFHKHSWYPSNSFLVSEALALGTNLLGGAILFLLAKHFALPLGYLLCLYVFAAATVLGELVPFAPGGVGPTEGGMTGILVVSGISLAPALVIVLLFRALTLVYGIVLGLIFTAVFYGSHYLKGRSKKAKHA